MTVLCVYQVCPCLLHNVLFPGRAGWERANPNMTPNSRALNFRRFCNVLLQLLPPILI